MEPKKCIMSIILQEGNKKDVILFYNKNQVAVDAIDKMLRKWSILFDKFLASYCMI